MAAKLPNVSFFFDRHGKRRWRFRKSGHQTVMLPGQPGDPSFMAAYSVAAAAAQLDVAAGRTRPGSVSEAIVAYYASAEWRELKPTTRRVHRNILERFRAGHGDNAKVPYGDRPLRALEQEFLLRIRDRMRDTPHAANNLMRVLHRLFKFAVSRKLMAFDPSSGMTALRIKSDGHHTWLDAELEIYKARWPSGTKQRLAFELYNNTSQRRGDVTRLGRQHDRGHALVVRQEKTGAELTIPITPELRRELDQVPRTQMTFLETEKERPYSPAYLGNKFAEWCKAAGLPDRCRAHGIRKAVATRLADAGHTAHEIMAITGHSSLSEVQRYTRAADQKRNAARTLGALSGTKPEQNLATPQHEAGNPGAKPLERKA